MKRSSRALASSPLLAAFTLAFLGLPATAQEAAPAAQNSAPLPWAGEERVEVELRTVPFYAMDSAGQPVRDLRADEVEVRVAGQPVAFDTFDAYGSAAPATAAGASASRHVVFFFDQTFSSLSSVRRSQEVALGLLDALPPRDRLYLVTNRPGRGIQQVLGPLAAGDTAARQQVAEAIGKVLMDPSRPTHNSDVDLPPMVMGSSRVGAPAEQVHNAYSEIRSLAEGEYLAQVDDFSLNLETFAAHLRQLQGPKLLYFFTGGINDESLFEGTVLFAGVGSSDNRESALVDVRRYSPKVARFEKPLGALVESGVQTVFINADGQRAAGRDALSYMRTRIGGQLFEDTDAKWLTARAAAATSALYEVGFYASTPTGDPAKAKIEVRVKRPGVRAWSVEQLTSRQTYRTLQTAETRLLITDLVRRGTAGRPLGVAASTESGASLGELPGRVAGKVDTGRRLLVFEPDWPADWAGKSLDLYTVVLAMATPKSEAEVLSFDRQKLVAAGQPLRLSAELPRDGARIFGVVAVDPVSGQTRFRRFLLEAPNLGGSVTAKLAK